MGTYVGWWKDDKPHGHGTYTWPSGNVYKGQWVDGQRLRGTYTRREKGEIVSVYKGDWEDSKMHGLGTFTDNTGSSYDGRWANGDCIAKFVGTDLVGGMRIREGQKIQATDSSYKFGGEGRRQTTNGSGLGKL